MSAAKDIMPNEDAFSEVRAFEAGKYRTLARLGQGGMAEVFLAVARGPVGFNKLLVIKRLKDELFVSPEHRSMFLDEARLAARLSHPNVVQTYEIAEDGERFLMTMEYLDGQPLSAVMKRTERRDVRLPLAFHAHVCAEALAGLHYAHELVDYDGTALKIVHRDVSPQNIFLTYDGQVKIVDFGVAKAEVSSNKTQAGVLKGKVAYMAPEQLAGDADRRSDVFTMGIVLWELVAGKRLMNAGSSAKTLMRVLHEKLVSPTEAGAASDPALDAVIMRALERDPDKRFQTAKEMRDALEEFIAGAPGGSQKEAVARVLEENFGEVRISVQAKIREKMAGVAMASGTMRAVTAPQSGSRPSYSQSAIEVTGAPTSVWSVPNLEPASSVTSMPPPLSSASSILHPPPSPPKRSRSVAFGIVLGAAAVCAIGFVAREKALTPIAAALPPPTSAAPQLLPSAVSAPAPTMTVAPPAPSSAPIPATQVVSQGATHVQAPEPAHAAPPTPRATWQRAPAAKALAPREAQSPPPPATASEPAPSPQVEAKPASSPQPTPTTTSTGRRIRTDY